MAAKGEPTFWSGTFGRFLLFLIALVLLAAGGAGAFLYTLTHPPRDTRVLDPADLLLRAETVTFQATDGVTLSGWFIKGRGGMAPLILCHDLGRSRSSLLNSAAALNRAGYPLLLFDFRGHGESGGRGASLGIDERHDVLGAVDYLAARPDANAARVGVWGIGTGAYAAVLAARDRPAIAALALDGLYADVPSLLDRMARARVPLAARFLVRPLHLFYDPYFAFRLGKYPVERLLADLSERSVLLIAGTDAPERLLEGRTLYAALRETPSGDKSFLELRTSIESGLYAEDKKQYDQALVAFFSTSLAPGARAVKSPRPPIEVLER